MTGGFFALLDDIASLLDSSATLTKVAAKNTAGVLGDDVAVNAEKATGFRASREIPGPWAITKGSLRNKLIIVPIALLLSAYAPWLIVPILLLGATYLGFEGAEAAWGWLAGPHAQPASAEPIPDTPEAILSAEQGKISSAVRTDFILSIEIVVIALGTVTGQPLAMQIIAVSIVALLATVGVYGIVTLLVRLDDIGLGMIRRSRPGRSFHTIGRGLVTALPRIVTLLSFVGVIAMLLVSGGIYLHHIDAIHHAVGHWPFFSGELAVGLGVGMLALGAEKGLGALLGWHD